MKPAIETYKGFRYFTGDNWCARCARCKKPLTKFAFTEVEARREGLSVDHTCRKGQA